MEINFQHVSFNYLDTDASHTLDDVSFKINSKDEFVALVGHTGSGKSTIAQLMNVLLLPSLGQITIFSRNVVKKRKKILKLRLKKNDLKYNEHTLKGLFHLYTKNIYMKNLHEIRMNVGLVFQFPEYQLFESTVIKDIAFGPKNFGKSNEESLLLAKEAASLVGLDESLFQKSPFSLSGGQMRRVAIAGILAMNPSILILDEPTVGLDPLGKIELMNLLSNIQEKTHKTIIMISHDMNIIAKHATRILVMKQGKLVYDGCKTTLFENEEMLHEFNLELPSCSLLAKELKQQGLINYTHLPLSKEELIDIICHQEEKTYE